MKNYRQISWRIFLIFAILFCLKMSWWQHQRYESKKDLQEKISAIDINQEHYSDIDFKNIHSGQIVNLNWDKFDEKLVKFPHYDENKNFGHEIVFLATINNQNIPISAGFFQEKENKIKIEEEVMKLNGKNFLIWQVQHKSWQKNDLEKGLFFSVNFTDLEKFWNTELTHQFLFIPIENFQESFFVPRQIKVKHHLSYQFLWIFYSSIAIFYLIRSVKMRFFLLSL